MSTGGCACGAVRYQVNGPLRPVVNCHCEPCRRSTGHFMAATAAAVDDVAFDADAGLRWFQRTPTVKYGFCGDCGSTLFWKAADSPSVMSITAGSVDMPTGLTTDSALFVSEAGDYHTLDQSITSYDFGRTHG